MGPAHSGDASQINLTTFNGLGGIYGLNNNEDNFTLTVLAGINSAANYVIPGDIVSRLGGGFVTGPIYQLTVSDPTQTNPITGLPYTDTLGPVDSHHIETGFYGSLGPEGFDLSKFQILSPSPGGGYVLQSDRAVPACGAAR